MEHRVGGEPAYRLRHDILDGAAIAAQLAQKPDGVALLFDHIGAGFGQIVAGQLVQRCEDVGDKAMIEAFFDRFLLYVDNKDYVDARGSWNPASWGAGFVVQQKLPAFAPLITNVLEAKTAESAEQNGAPFSHRGRTAKISLGALSSVASMLRGAGDAGLYDPGGRLRRALVRHIKSPHVKKKGRLIEGLGRLRDKAGRAHASIHELQRLLPKLRSDAAAAGYAAEALAQTRDPKALKVLDRVAAKMRKRGPHSAQSVGAHAASLREIIERRNQLAERLSVQALPPPPLTLEEVEVALRLHGDNKSDVSDWVTWRRYADKLARSAEGRRLVSAHPPIIEWLARGRWHDHAQTRRDAMLALCDLDHDHAFFALLEASIWESVNTVEDAIFSGLRRHAQRWRDEQRGASGAILIAQAAARRAGIAGDDRAGGFATALRMAGGEPTVIVTAGAIEIGAFTESTITQRAWRSPDAETTRVINATSIDPGPELEEKHTLEGPILAHNRLEASLRRVLWRESVCHHKGLLKVLTPPPLLARRVFQKRDDDADAHDAAIALHVHETQRAIHATCEALEGRTQGPAIAGVHVIVATPDRKVLVARRSAASHFYPRLRSASFEEQIRPDDLGEHNPFLAAALRGLGEEFPSREGGAINLLGQSLAFERETQGYFVMLVLRAETALCESLVTSAHAEEIEHATLTPLSTLMDDVKTQRDWHPTTAARALLATRLI